MLLYHGIFYFSLFFWLMLLWHGIFYFSHIFCIAQTFFLVEFWERFTK
jgi:hypothetical protein